MVSPPCEGAEEYGDCSSRLMGGGTGPHDHSDTEGRHVMTFYYRRPSTPLGGEQTLLPLESLSPLPICPTPQAPGNLEEPTRREWMEEGREGEERQLLYFPAFLSWCWGGEGGPVPWTLTCGVFSADFHEVRPTEVETERQDRSQRQAELGWGGSGVPAPDRGVHLHQGSVSSPPLLVFPPHGWVARGGGLCPRLVPATLTRRLLSAPQVRGEDRCSHAERAEKNPGEACLAFPPRSP